MTGVQTCALPISALAIAAPRRTIAVAALAMVAAGIFGIPVGDSLTAGGFADPTSESARATKTLTDKFGQGDVALLRTGWGRNWADQDQYTTAGKGHHVAGPGPEEPAARWLSAKGVFAVGSDTLAFEHVPSSTMPVHIHLLVESGIHIIENLNLEELARDGVTEFLLFAAPLKIRGGTGSPLRPVALVA